MAESIDSGSSGDEFREAIERYQRLVQSGRCADAEEMMEAIMQHVTDRAETDDSPDWKLVVEAAACEAAHDYEGMEQAHKKRLALVDCPSCFGVHQDLAQLYIAINRHDDALAHAQVLDDAGRQSEVAIAAAMELRSAGNVHLRLGLVGQAEKLFGEALARLDVDDPSYDQMRASLLTLLAECDVVYDRIGQAAERLDGSLELLRPKIPMLSAAGVQGDFAKWWVVTAQVRQKSGAWEEAIEAWEQAVALSRHVADLYQWEGIQTPLFVAGVLHKYAEASAAMGELEKANRLAAESAAIVANLDLPSQRYY